jgi:hypothetical protein
MSSDGLTRRERLRRRREARREILAAAPGAIKRARAILSEGEFICAIRELLGLEPYPLLFTGRERS